MFINHQSTSADNTEEHSPGRPTIQGTHRGLIPVHPSLDQQPHDIGMTTTGRSIQRCLSQSLRFTTKRNNIKGICTITIKSVAVRRANQLSPLPESEYEIGKCAYRDVGSRALTQEILHHGNMVPFNGEEQWGIPIAEGLDNQEQP